MIQHRLTRDGRVLAAASATAALAAASTSTAAGCSRPTNALDSSPAQKCIGRSAGWLDTAEAK